MVNDGLLILDYTQSASKLSDAGTLTVNGGILSLTNGSTSDVVGAVTLTGGVITNSGGTSKLSVSAGFQLRVRGSHHIFSCDGVEEILNLQPRGANAKNYQVKQVRNIILKYKLSEERL